MTTPKPFQIVAAVAFDATANPTWTTACALLENPHARLSLIHVVPATERNVRRESSTMSDLVGEWHARLQAILVRELGDASNALKERVDVYVALGDPATEIVQLAADLTADLIVVGANERSRLERLVLGSVSSEVFKRAPCSVLVARPVDYSGLEKTPEIAAPPAPGQASTLRPHAVVRYRSTPFSTYNANLFPNGIPREQVR